MANQWSKNPPFPKRKLRAALDAFERGEPLPDGLTIEEVRRRLYNKQLRKCFAERIPDFGPENPPR
jgi:hypothetical protein